MNAGTFDTLAATRALEAAGMERAIADATAEQLRAGAGAVLDQFATKADLYRASWLQGAAIVGLVVALVKLL